MNEKRLLHISAWYCVAVGTLNIGTWSFLILTGDPSEFLAEPAAFGFHWFSEFITAFLLLLSGILLLKKKPVAVQLLFVSLGLLLMAVGGAFIYYLVNFETVIFAMTALLTGGTIILLIMNYRSFKDFILITQGALTYALLNITGQSVQNSNLSLLSMALPVLLFVIIITINLLGKEIIFKHPGKTASEN